MCPCKIKDTHVGQPSLIRIIEISLKVSSIIYWDYLYSFITVIIFYWKKMINVLLTQASHSSEYLSRMNVTRADQCSVQFSFLNLHEHWSFLSLCMILVRTIVMLVTNKIMTKNIDVAYTCFVTLTVSGLGRAARQRFIRKCLDEYATLHVVSP